MRKSLTFIFLWLACILTAQPQTGIIKVNVEDGCGNAFHKPVTIDLYQVIGNNLTKIASSNSYPALFENLNQGNTYEVQISSPDVTDTDVSIKDAYAMRKTILGIILNLGHLPSIFASDANGNFRISTIDLVLFMRYLVKIPQTHISFKGWFFVDQNHLDGHDSSFKNRTIVQGIHNGHKEITFNGYQHGAMVSTVHSFCGTCTEDTTSTKSIQFPDRDVIAGQQVRFNLGITFSPNDQGFSFSLKYNDGIITSLAPLNGTITNLIDSTSTINFARIDEPNSNHTYTEFAKISFTPQKSGKLSSFFTINNQYKNEFIYTDGDCLKTYQNLTIKDNHSCHITWPADKTIPDCSFHQNAGVPIISPSCSNITGITYTDQTFGNPCNKILRTWTVINWLTSELFTHIQVLTVAPVHQLDCVGFATLLLKDSIKIWAVDFVKNPNNNHVYSFSHSDSSKQSMYFYNWMNSPTDVLVYDLTANTSCLVKLTIHNSGCKDTINTISAISVNEANGDYLVRGDMFDGGNLNHCLGRIHDFQFRPIHSANFVDQLSFEYEAYKGTTLIAELSYRINGINVKHGLVKINFLEGPALPPFEIACYDDPVTKNEIFEVSFFSSTFNNIFALQAAIRLKNAIMVSTKKKALKDIAFNEELRSLRFVWLLPTAAALTLTGSDTLFTMTIRPTESGNLSDILSIADDLMQSEAVLNDFDQTKVSLVFRFLKRSTATQDIIKDDITIFPNPTSTGVFSLKSNNIKDATISVYNESGQEVSVTHQNTRDGFYQITVPEGIKNGVYFVRLINEKKAITKKIILLK